MFLNEVALLGMTVHPTKSYRLANQIPVRGIRNLLPNCLSGKSKRLPQ